jgi:bifunctional non-homologous end joining protein LigD
MKPKPNEPRQTPPLFYREGSSDKVYALWLERAAGGGGWNVKYGYGRRGRSLKIAFKNPAPLSWENANAVYEEMLAAKLKQGYTTDVSGKPFTPSKFNGGTASDYTAPEVGERATDFGPMLLTPITDADPYLDDPDWVMQSKVDGERRFIVVSDDGKKIVGGNRRGLVVALPMGIAKAAKLLAHGTIFDGEIVGEDYVAFDLLRLEAQDLREQPYATRLEMLEQILEAFPRNGLRLIQSYFAGKKSRRLELQAWQQGGREGVVFKRLDAPYREGRSDDALKLKFTASASVIVAAVNQGVRSVRIKAVDDTPLGNVTIPVNKAIPRKGSIIELKYLYAYRGGSLFQPVYVGVRKDIEPGDCTTAQLKYVKEEDASG